MALFLGHSLRYYSRAIVNVESFVCLAVDEVGKLIRVDLVASCDFDVVRGHCFGHILPAGKSVALLFWNFGSCHGLSEHNSLCLNHLIANLECGVVAVYRERAADGDIFCGHRLGQAFPTGECVALFLGQSFRRDSRAIVNVERFVSLVIDEVGKLIRVDLVASCDFDVVRGHCFGHILPAGKSVALLFWNFGSCHGLSEHNRLYLNHLVANLECGVVAVDGE